MAFARPLLGAPGAGQLQRLRGGGQGRKWKLEPGPQSGPAAGTSTAWERGCRRLYPPCHEPVAGLSAARPASARSSPVTYPITDWRTLACSIKNCKTPGVVLILGKPCPKLILVPPGGSLR